MKLLIIDDEHRIGMLISKLIHFEEVPVELLAVKDDSLEALKLILEEKPDIVISDIQMPVMDGLEMIEKVLSEGLSPHFILISGFREFEYARQALKYGIEDYLLKPVKEEELNEVLKKVCALHQEMLDKENETQALKASAIREHKLSGRDALIALEKEKVSSPAELNTQYHLHFQEGLCLCFQLRLDTEDFEDIAGLENRILLNTLVSLLEERFESLTFEQLYHVQEDREITGLLNFDTAEKEDISREIQAAFIDVKGHTTVFEKKYITMAVGEMGTFAEMDRILSSAKARLAQRIVLGVDRIIDETAWEKDTEKKAMLSNDQQYALRNAVSSFDEEAMKQIFFDMFSRYGEIAAEKAWLYRQGCVEFVNAVFRIPEIADRFEERHAQILSEINNCFTKEMFIKLMKDMIHSTVSEIRKDRQEQTRKPIRDALDYIEAHYGEKITQEDVCEVLQMNTSYFSVLFKKEVGENFQNYLTNFRMEKAKELLRNTMDTMAAIASQVGYTDTKYFSQTFAKIVGMKPSLYRKMYS